MPTNKNPAAVVEPSEPELAFDSPFALYDIAPLTLVELRLRRYAEDIRSNARWWEQIDDASMVARWRKSMMEDDKAMIDATWATEQQDDDDGRRVWPREKITKAQLDWIFAEAKWEAARMDTKTGIHASATPGVYESQILIARSLRAALLAGVSKLEDELAKEDDPRYLVDPSLYPIRIGFTHVLTRKNDEVTGTHVLSKTEYGKRPDLQREKDIVYALSEQFQWLPTDFEVSKSGRIRPLGYINNLDPAEHKEMYPTISHVLERFIPLFERVFSDMLNPAHPHVVQVDPLHWYDGLSNSDEVEEEAWPSIPDPTPFAPPAEGDRVTFSLKGRTLQVITKLESIKLSPENPAHAGSPWQAEGTPNERIVACGMYCYSSSNVTPRGLAFRAAVGDPDPTAMVGKYFAKGDERGCLGAYGLKSGAALNQEIGQVELGQDRCVAWPNVQQWSGGGLELVDGEQPGHWKALCFALVDPLARIVSTSDVPPQQEEWRLDEVVHAPFPKPAGVSKEVYAKVMGKDRRGRMSPAEAEEVREALEAERAELVERQAEEVYELEFQME